MKIGPEEAHRYQTRAILLLLREVHRLQEEISGRLMLAKRPNEEVWINPQPGTPLPKQRAQKSSRGSLEPPTGNESTRDDRTGNTNRRRRRRRRSNRAGRHVKSGKLRLPSNGFCSPAGLLGGTLDKSCGFSVMMLRLARLPVQGGSSCGGDRCHEIQGEQYKGLQS